MRVVVDANVFVSFLLTRGQTITKIVSTWKDGGFTLLVSDEILVEYKQILGRFVEKEIVQEKIAQALFDEILEGTFIIHTKSVVEISKDREDNRYLACAKDGEADYFVTGDKKHLLPLKRFEKTKIVSPKEFVDLLEKV